jgi:hypothetical protein
MRRMLGGVLVATALLAVSMTTGSAAPASPDGSAPAGPRIPYLVHDGNTWTIHDGATTLPLPVSVVDNSDQTVTTPGTFGLLGRSTHGYVVRERADSSEPDPAFRVEQLQLHVVRPDGTARTFYDRSGPGRIYAVFGRTDTGDHVLAGSSFAEEVNWRVSGVRLDGRVTPSVSWGYLPQVLDVPSARRVLIASGPRLTIHDLVDHTRRRLPGVSEQHALTTRVGDLGSDLFGWRQPRRPRTPVTMAFARLSRPGHVLWKAPFDAFAFNATGARLLGWSKRPRSQISPRVPLQVRRAADGAVLGTLDYGLAGVDSVAWEDRSHVLVSYAGTVVRCSVRGVCHRILVSPGTVQLAGP